MEKHWNLSVVARSCIFYSSKNEMMIEFLKSALSPPWSRVLLWTFPYSKKKSMFLVPIPDTTYGLPSLRGNFRRSKACGTGLFI